LNRSVDGVGPAAASIMTHVKNLSDPTARATTAGTMRTVSGYNVP